MQASLCLRAPQLSLTLHRQRSTLQCHFGYEKYFVALRRQTNSSYRALRAAVRAQTPSSDPAPPSHESRTLAAAASAAVVTVALASAMACICPSWSGRGRISLAAPWDNININITKGAERGRPEGKRDFKRKMLKRQIAMRPRTAADQALHKIFESEDLPAKFYEITPNYPKIKGNVAEANKICTEISKNSPGKDHRPLIRSAIINMIKDWDKKKEGEKKTEWENFASKIKDIVNRPFIDVPVEEP
ncbi:hypothetical protein IEQ34_004214 [Dendrobium chrysotoxum]|uniref:Uncharacterized protein n=1 Tax=Dendrobium chrysotoxum TaxID=161865 RepID=A0AAV7HDG7_DENCH|nr:hypothetical protein IEQ34_004214 [Dendrobium chrysotoxum]